MKVKVTFFSSLCIVCVSVFYIINILNQDIILSKDNEYEESINIWITTPGISSVLDQFQDQFNIRVNIKQFTSTDKLIEELELKNNESNYPDIVEVNSNYGLDELIATGEVYPIEKINKAITEKLHPAMLDNFRYKETLYGFPLGIEMPLLIINRSILNHYFSVDAVISPFTSQDLLEKYKSIQEKITTNKTNPNLDPFWLFHFDQDVPVYWNSFVQSKANQSNYFLDTWESLIQEYNLVPPLDSHMAITRFSNMEVGVLVTTSNKLQIIQELVGNSFEFEVVPLVTNEPNLVFGSGFVAFTNHEKVELLFKYMMRRENQLEYLSNTGWLPAQVELLDDLTFIHNLPMSKHLSKLLQDHLNFIGSEVKKDSREAWFNLKDKAHEIEKRSD